MNELTARNIDRKLDVLSRVAEKFNGKRIRWAVGGSMLLYLSGCACDVHDIDIMIDENDAEEAREILRRMGQMQERTPDVHYASRVFLECTIDGVDFDVIGGFTILRQDAVFYLPLKAGEIAAHIEIGGQDIPLHAVEAWREYYLLMGRESKVALIDSLPDAQRR